MIMNLLISLMVPAGSLSVVDPQAKQDAVPTFVGILRNDEPRSVRLGNLTQGTWEVLGDQGWMTWTPGVCLALERDDEWFPRTTDLQVHLTDGQIVVGDLVSGDDEHLVIDHLWMRELVIPLDRIDRVHRRGEPVVSRSPADEVFLVNGDSVTGFVERIANPVRFETDGDDGSVIEIPMNRISAIDLQGEREHPAWPQIWLVDGSRLHLDSIGFNDEGVFTLSRHPFMSGDYERLPTAREAVAVILEGDAYTPLATCPVTAESLSRIPLTAHPPRLIDPNRPLGITEMDLRGPMQYTFTLPDAAHRLRAVLERPRRSRVWPAPKVTVMRGDSVLWSGRTSTRMPLDLDLHGQDGPLVITIESSGHGPVHSGMLLRDAIVLR